MKLIKSFVTGLLALVAFLWICTPTLAQDTTAIDTSKVYKLGEVIVSAGKYKQSPQSVGRNVTVISKSEIERSIHTSLGGILAEQQSLHVVGNNQTQGAQQSVFLRNTNSNHTVVMIDGVRISDPSSTENTVDLSKISLAGVQRIEIVRGSHSTLYGSSAIGGVINIITRDRDQAGYNVDLDTQVGALQGDTYSTENSLSLSGMMDNGLYANLAASQSYTNGFDATVDTAGSGFNPQDKDGFRKLDLFGKLGYRSSGWNIHASYRRADQHTEVDQGAFTDDGNARQNFDRELVNYGVSAELSNRWALDFSGGYSTLDRSFVNDSSVVDAQGTYDHTYTETSGDGTLWENELRSTFSGENVKIIAGVESNRQAMNLQSYTYISSYDYESETNLDSLDLRETINSVYIHGELGGGLLDESWEPFSLVLGSRLADHSRYGTNMTYEINPQVQLSKSSLLYGAVTTGFNAPSLYQLHAPQKSFGAYTNRGNVDLEPEESVSYELGWKQELSKSVHLELSLFRTDVKNVIEYVYLWDANTAVSNLSNQDYLGDTYINISKQHINGVELGFEVQAISNLSVNGNLSYSSSKIIFAPDNVDQSYTGGNHVQIYESGAFVDEKRQLEGLTRRPNFSANVHLDYRPASDWTIGLSSQYVGARDDIYYSAQLGPYGAQDLSQVDGYNITDVSLRYRINQNIGVVGKVKNVFDTEYTEINGYRTRGRGVYLKASLSF